jgi:NitT/TauT family transport system substrate-binding protein
VWEIADAWGLPFDCLILRDPVLSGERPLSTRRQLLLRTLGTGAAIVGGSALAACARQSEAATLETTTVRIVYPVDCDPGLVLAERYLLKEGFTDVQFVNAQFTTRGWITKNLADFACAHSEFAVGAIADGLPLRVLSGLHSGCLELWVRDGITAVRDLRGRRISVRVKDIADMFYAWFAILLGGIGITLKDVDFVEAGGPDDYPGMIGAFVEGRADAVLAGGPQGPFLKRLLKRPGHVILETMTETPWSQYFCCNLVANRDWAQQNPVATKAVTRALLRATDAAASDHARAARDAVALIAARSKEIGGPAASGNFEDESIVTETMAMCTYNWRELDPEDTLRFFALQLANVGLITSTPQQIIARGSDFAYMRQWKSESKS